MSQVPDDLYYKQPQTPAILAAKDVAWLGRVFLDWSKFPDVGAVGTFGAPPNGRHYTRVRFKDLRFAYPVLLLKATRATRWTESVTIAPDGSVDEMEMGGHVQKVGLRAVRR